MSHTKIFRTFLISDAFLTSVNILAGVVMATGADAVESPESLLSVSIEIAVLVIWIAALAGLWRFRNWARPLYLAVAGVGVLGSLLVGSEQRSGLVEALNAVCWLATGAIIALAYWSPVAAAFQRYEPAS